MRVFTDLDDLRAAKGPLGVGPWTTVDQARIDLFADATDDHQWIHVDPERAKAGPFGAPIAHGLLTLSLVPELVGQVFTLDGARMGVNYGGNKVRFLTPVRSGARVRGRFRPLAFEEKRPGQFQQTTEFTVEIEGHDKPALIAEWIGQIFI